MSKKPQPEDLILMLAWTEKVMQEMKQFLKDQHPGSAENQNPDDSQVSMPQEVNSAKVLNPLAMIATKAEAAIQEVEKLDRDAEIIERLVTLEKQTRRIALIGLGFIGLTTVILLVFALHLGQVYLGDKISLLPGAQGISPHQPQNLAGGPGSAPKTSVAATDSQKSIPRQPEAASSPPSPGADAAPRYIGSKTSNKYHYPDCRWAKRISPQNLTTFPSVKEAQGKGYISCPGCKPPLTD
jgi:hypothetical protein